MERFARVYRDNVDAVAAYFARRSTEPQTVADLTSETFVQAIGSFAGFDPRRGAERPWLFGIARRVFAGFCEDAGRRQDKTARLAGRRDLEADEIGELLDRIDAERAGRALLARLAELPAVDRAIVELVDLAGFSPAQAAAALGVSGGAARMRLMRARARLRGGADTTTTTP